MGRRQDLQSCQKSKDSLIQCHFLGDDLSSGLTQRHSCKLFRQDKGLIFLIALSDQPGQVSIVIHSPHIQFFEHDDELLDDFIFYQGCYFQLKVGVEQLPQSDLIFRSELNPPDLTLAESGGLVSKIVEKECKLKMWIFWCFVMYYPFHFLNLVYFPFGWLRFLYEVLILAAAGQSPLPLLESFTGDVDRVSQFFVVPVAALIDHLPDDFVTEGKETGLLNGGF